MEVDSDSSSDSVIITGPIPAYPQLRKQPRRATSSKNGHKSNGREHIVDITFDEKVEKIQELEDLVKATATLSRTDKDEDVDVWSGSDTKSVKGSGKRESASKYLKKIKTLQQNKRRQETRISRLTKEVRSLRDKNSVQAAYIDVLCGMLGEEMKEKFRERQGLGILGNTRTEEDDNVDGLGAVEGSAWTNDGAINPKPSCSDKVLKDKEREYYCVEDLDELPENDLSRTGSSEDLKDDAKDEQLEGGVVRPIDINEPSTSYGVLANGIASKDMLPSGMSALTIEMGGMKHERVHMLCNNVQYVDDDKEISGFACGNGQDEIHHTVFGSTYNERRLCVYEGQVGESVFAQVPQEKTNPYVQVAYMKPHREPLTSYGVVMGNNGMSLLPAVHPTTDDPLNIGTEDSSFGPLIITTSLDPLNLIHPSNCNDRLKIGPTPHDPLNIEDDFIGDSTGPSGIPGNETSSTQPDQDNHTEKLELDHQTSLKESTDVTPGTSMETDLTTEQALPSNDDNTETKLDAVVGNVPSDMTLDFGSLEGVSDQLEDDIKQESDQTCLDQNSDSTTVLSQGHPADDQPGSISPPQAIVDHLLNISCQLSPELKLE